MLETPASAIAPVASDDVVATRPPNGGHTAETAIVGAITIAALYLGQSLLIPLALAIFLTFLLSPVVTGLIRLHLPKGFAVAIVALTAFLSLLLFGFFIGRQVSAFAEDLPRYKTTLTEKIKTIKTIASAGTKLERANETLKSLRKEMETEPPRTQGPSQFDPQKSSANESPPKPLTVTLETPTTPLEQLTQTIGAVAPPLVTTGIVALFVIILLLYREDLRDRAIRLFGVHDLERTTRALDDAGNRLNRYFLATTAINVAFGSVIGAGLWWIGIPNPILWGVLAMLMRYVPFIGVPLAAVLPVVLSIVVDPGWTMLAATLGLFVLSELFVSQVVETFVHSEATGLSPLAVILATTFWTLLWGPVGLVLAVPLTVMLAVLGRHVERFALLEVLLGAAPALSPADRFYQRILAGDPEEAADQAQGQLEDMTLAAYYDSVVMEALKKAMRDAEAGRLDPSRFGQIYTSVAVFLDAMSDGLEDEPDVASQDSSPKPVPDRTRGDGVRQSAGPVILCVAAKNKLDEAAAAMLAQLLEARGLHARVATPAQLGRGADLSLSSVRIVCMSAFDAGERSAHVKFLTRRLRRLLPAAQFLGGFWRLEADNPAHQILIGSIGADEIVSTLNSAVDCCILHGHGAPLSSDEAQPPRAAPIRATATPG